MMVKSLCPAFPIGMIMSQIWSSMTPNWPIQPQRTVNMPAFSVFFFLLCCGCFFKCHLFFFFCIHRLSLYIYVSLLLRWHFDVSTKCVCFLVACLQPVVEIYWVVVVVDYQRLYSEWSWLGMIFFMLMLLLSRSSTWLCISFDNNNEDNSLQ